MQQTQPKQRAKNPKMASKKMSILALRLLRPFQRHSRGGRSDASNFSWEYKSVQ